MKVLHWETFVCLQIFALVTFGVVTKVTKTKKEGGEVSVSEDHYGRDVGIGIGF